MPSWVSFTPPSNSTDDLTQRIHELIEWYEQNFTRKEDDYIKANLQLIITLAKNVKNSDDTIREQNIIYSSQGLKEIFYGQVKSK